MFTLKDAHKAGWDVVRGAYHGTIDDRADRWYVDRLDDTVIDRRGPGFETRKEALRWIEERVREERLTW